MDAKQIADRIINKSGSYQEVMNYAEGMIAPLITRAETAEVRAAQAEAERDHQMALVNSWIAAHEQMKAERDEASRQLSEAQHTIDVLSNTVVAQDAEIKRLNQAREDIAEYRAEAAETARDAAWTELREIRRLIEADEDESTIDEVTRKLYRISKDAHDAEQERDESRRQLSEAKHAIDVLSNTIVAQDAEIKRLNQAREDVAEYRAEIARLNQAATA